MSPFWRIFRRIRTWIARILGVLLFFLLISGSTIQVLDSADRVRRYTRPREFNYLFWTVDALAQKIEQFGSGITGYLPEAEHQNLISTYFDLLADVMRLEDQLAQVIADPALENYEEAAGEIIRERDAKRERIAQLQPVAEGLLQDQVAIIIRDLGIELGGAPFPPVSFHFTQPPVALIISPRNVIRQDANISLDPALTLEEIIELEKQVEAGMDVSALVVPIGGVGVYPTMISESTSLVWLTEVIAHEWVHNYLTLRPLGLNYEKSPKLRTMNETTANIVGKEIGRLVLERYYPELVPPPVVEPSIEAPVPEEPPKFDFRVEMRETRETVDALLAEGRIQEAEAYMEARRQFFWENGHYIRRLNQAYFAFYGAYADESGGAAGEDPVGSAVRQLWALIGSPREFLNLMSWMNDYADLQEAVVQWTDTQ